tara:strand:+ start:4287 stop:4493 length:207 start_codon:yes stop_codon:yes gene_type:complete
MFKIDQFTHLKVLLNEVKILQSKLLPEDTGHIHTTISTLESRIEEIGDDISKTSIFSKTGIERISKHG